MASFPIVFRLCAIFSRINVGGAAHPSGLSFALLFAAAVWQYARMRPALVAVLVLAVALQAADILRYAPDYITYFTPFVRPSETYKLLSDSNLDWGQGWLALRQYIRTHPQENISVVAVNTVVLDSYDIHVPILRENQRVSGTVIIGASDLTGQFLRNPDAYHWVLQYPRTQILDHSLFVFKVPPEAVDSYALEPVPQQPADEDDPAAPEAK